MIAPNPFGWLLTFRYCTNDASSVNTLAGAVISSMKCHKDILVANHRLATFGADSAARQPSVQVKVLGFSIRLPSCRVCRRLKWHVHVTRLHSFPDGVEKIVKAQSAGTGTIHAIFAGQVLQTQMVVLSHLTRNIGQA